MESQGPAPKTAMVRDLPPQDLNSPLSSLSSSLLLQLPHLWVCDATIGKLSIHSSRTEGNYGRTEWVVQQPWDCRYAGVWYPNCPVSLEEEARDRLCHCTPNCAGSMSSYNWLEQAGEFLTLPSIIVVSQWVLCYSSFCRLLLSKSQTYICQSLSQSLQTLITCLLHFLPFH